MKTLFLNMVLAGFISVVVLSADTASSIRLPLLGFAPTPSFGGLRPVWGTFGSDTLDDPIALSPDIRLIVAAPGQQYALAERGDQNELGIVTLNEVTGAGTFQSVAGAISNADRIAFSPNGSAAVVYASQAQRLQVLTGLPAAPQITRDVDLSAWAGTVVALAVSDDAAGLLVASSIARGNSTISTIAADGSATTVFAASSVSAIRFLPGAHDAIIADALMNQIILLSGPSFSPKVLAGNSQGVSTPLALEASTDGRRVYAANSGAQNVLMIDVTTGDLTALPCGFAPAAFGRLLKSVVSVTAQDGNDVWLLDTDSALPWVAYTPRSH